MIVKTASVRSMAILNKIMTYQTHKNTQPCIHWWKPGLLEVGVNCFYWRIRVLKVWGEFQVSGWAVADWWLFICRLLHLANTFSTLTQFCPFIEVPLLYAIFFAFYFSPGLFPHSSLALLQSFSANRNTNWSTNKSWKKRPQMDNLIDYSMINYPRFIKCHIQIRSNM